MASGLKRGEIMEAEIELSLELSIGRPKRKAEADPGEIKDPRRKLEKQVRKMAADSQEKKVKEEEAFWAHRPQVMEPQFRNPNPSTPAIAMRYPFPQVKYVPVANGFGVTCMMPCWAPAISPVDYRCTTAQVENKGWNLDSDAEKGVEKDLTDTSSSSSIQSGSLQVGSNSSSSSDSRSNSTSMVEKPRLHHASSQASNPQDKPASIQATTTAQSSQAPTSDNNTPSSVLPKLEGDNSVNKPTSLVPLREAKSWSPLAQMPTVSTRGDGPEGKTITGVLYKYRNAAEVSILCVCHGTTFSPAEFVRHAGGTVTEHPLRQIAVISSRASV